MATIEMLKRVQAIYACDTRNFQQNCEGKECEECDYCYAQGFFKERMEALSEAIYALEKQIPLKVEKIKRRPTEWGSPYVCPACGAEQTKTSFSTADGKEPKEMYTWCYGCGHKLDWKGGDE